MALVSILKEPTEYFWRGYLQDIDDPRWVPPRRHHGIIEVEVLERGVPSPTPGDDVREAPTADTEERAVALAVAAAGVSALEIAQEIKEAEE